MDKPETDKYKNKLVPEYEKLFNNIHNEKLKILEIGVLHGEGLEYLQLLFPNSTIYGGDIVVPDTKFKVFACDQNDPSSLIKIVNDVGPFDIIIDDGCHMMDATMTTFDALWPHTKMYVIEDWIAHYWGPPYNGILDTVLHIVKNKTELGIKEINLILKEPRCSLAYFSKLIN